MSELERRLVLGIYRDEDSPIRLEKPSLFGKPAMRSTREGDLENARDRFSQAVASESCTTTGTCFYENRFDRERRTCTGGNLTPWADPTSSLLSSKTHTHACCERVRRLLARCRACRRTAILRSLVVLPC